MKITITKDSGEVVEIIGKSEGLPSDEEIGRRVRHQTSNEIGREVTLAVEDSINAAISYIALDEVRNNRGKR